MIDVTLVPQEYVWRFWPKCKDMIRDAFRRGGIGSFSATQEAVLANKCQLWIAFTDKTIEAAAITELQLTEKEKVLAIHALGGKDMKSWFHFKSKIEAFAKDEGCKSVHVTGRRGWERVLKDYRPFRVVLQKAIA